MQLINFMQLSNVQYGDAVSVLSHLAITVMSLSTHTHPPDELVL